MPLLYVQRFGAVIVSGGTQAVAGTLSFAGPTVVELDPALYTQPGTYVLFTYGSFNNAEMANLTVDDDDLIGLTAGSPVNDTANSRITVTLS